MATEITTRQLLDLRPGAILTVTLPSGREYTGPLQRIPTLAQVGKPGIHRVRLDVLDIEAANKISDNASIFARPRCVHTIPGHRVVAIK